MFGFEILSDISQGVIDHNDLIHFYWFSIKWIVAKILEKIRLALELLRLQHSTKQLTEKDVKIIQIEVNKFWKLNFPKTLKNVLADTVDAVFSTMNIMSTRNPKFDNYDNNFSFIVLNFEDIRCLS